MTALWFGLAAIALLGAVGLLRVERSRRDQFGRLRQTWAKTQGYDYDAEDRELVSRFGRAALSKPEFDVALGVVEGVRRGEQFVLFDVEETATIVAVRRKVGSDVDIDLRPKSTPPPRDEDMELLGSIGPRVVFATDVDIARRVCDQRMAAFTESVPECVLLLWSEGEWTLGSLSLSSTSRDWDDAIDAVARLSGMLHVLPPIRSNEIYGARTTRAEASRDRSDPGRPGVREQAQADPQPATPVPAPRAQQGRGEQSQPQPHVRPVAQPVRPRAAAPRSPQSASPDVGSVQSDRGQSDRVQPDRVQPRPDRPRSAPPRESAPRPVPADRDRRRPQS